MSSRSVKVSAYVFDHIGRTKKDFKLDTFRAGGKGGQHQNKTESGVRLTDLKTGLSAESREHREQLQNKNAAFNKLINLLIEHYTKMELVDKVARIRSATEEVRVYKEAMHMVKDSATGHAADYKDTLNGKTLDGFIAARQLKEAQS